MNSKIILLAGILISIHFNVSGQIINSSFYTDKHNQWQYSKEKQDAKKGAIRSKEQAKNSAAYARELADKAADSRSALEEARKSTGTDAKALEQIKTLSMHAAQDESLADEADDIAYAKAVKAADTAKLSSDFSGYVFGSGTLTSLETPSTPNANLSLGVVLFCKRSSFSVAFNPKAASSPDSTNLKKSFLFPEISSRAFVFEYDKALNQKDTNGSNTDKCIGCKPSTNFFVNFSTGSIKDSGNHLITPYNFITGFRFTYTIDLSNNSDSSIKKLKNLTLSLLPCYSMTTIDPKDFNNYDTLFKKPNYNNNLQATVDAIGGKLEVEIGSLHIFFDYKYILNSHYNSVFNNSYWTIGTSINTRLFSF